MLLSEDIPFLSPSPSPNAVHQDKTNIGFGHICMENFSW